MMRWFIVVVLALVACEKPAEPVPQTVPVAKTTAPVVVTPEEVITAYYAAMADKRYEDAYAMVSKPDRDARPYAIFLASASDLLQEAIAAKRKFEIKETIIEGDKVLVRVDSHGADIARLQRIIVAKYVSTHNDQKPTGDELKELMFEELRQPEIPMILTHQQLFLIREDGRWMLDFDWDKEHPARGVPVQERPKKPAPDAGSAAGDQ